MKPIFRHTSKDAVLLIQPLMALAITGFMITTDPALWWIPAGVFQAWLITLTANGPLHHHAHWNLFNYPAVSRAYEYLMSIVVLAKFHTWKSAHIKHHRFVNDRPVDGKTKDPTSVFLNGKDNEREPFWNYVTTRSNWKFNDIINFAPGTKIPTDAKKAWQENWAIRAWILFLFLVNPVYALFMLCVYYLGSLGDAATSYGEHWGVLDRRGDTTQDSIGIYTPWYNLLAANAGYHQEHHHRPGVHWTKLPEVTKELHPNRVILTTGMHLTNNPFWQDFKLLFKPSSSSSTD